jgi:hypothetical protein
MFKGSRAYKGKGNKDESDSLHEKTYEHDFGKLGKLDHGVDTDAVNDMQASLKGKIGE